MPYDFTKLESYTVDYDDLEKELLALPNLFRDKQIHKSYIRNWCNVLKLQDEFIVNQMKNPSEFAKYLKHRDSEPEVYKVSVNIGKNTFYLHFRIDATRAAIKSVKNIVPEVYSIEEFYKKYIKWTRETEKGKKPSDEPIIIVPYPIGEYSAIVIDGNHRLSEKIRKGEKTINVHAITAKSCIDNKFLASGFDLFLYAFFVESRCAYNCLKEGKSDMEIAMYSFLNSPKSEFLFDESKYY